MKINRFVALAAIAVLVVGAMSAFALRTFAQTAPPAAPTQDCAADQADDAAEAEGQEAADTDAGEAECDDGQADAQETETEDDGAEAQDQAPAGTPAITAETAQQIAETYLNGAPATRIELEDEDGRLVYSVDFATDAGVTEVQVDAQTGEVVATETGDD